VAWPVARSAIDYPKRALEGNAEPLGKFAKSQLIVVWREFRAVLWSIGLSLVVLLLLVALMRGFAAILVVVTIKSVLAAYQLLEAGESLPELAIFTSILSAAVLMLIGIGSLFLAASHLLRITFGVVRARYLAGQKFRSCRPFWRLSGRTLFRVFGGVFVAAAGAAACYALAAWAVQAPDYRVWLGVPTVSPVFLLLFWRLRIARELRSLRRISVERIAGIADERPGE
jgi:hypothetical protein